jgi:hypothetical protein
VLKQLPFPGVVPFSTCQLASLRTGASRLTTVIVTVALFFLLSISVCAAAVFNCSSGDVACLINAINAANANAEADTISLESGVYTITAAAETNDDGPNGLPSITTAITIVGDRSLIRRDPTFGQFDGPELRIFHVGETGNLTIDSLIIAGGFLSDLGRDGPGILNRGTTNVTNSTISRNVTIFGSGGGIYNMNGTLTVDGSIITDNTVVEGVGGGVASSGITNIAHSTISNNSADLAVGAYH